MRVGLVFEKKTDFPFMPGDPEELDSELLSDAEEDALLSGLRDAGHDVVRIGDGKRLVERPGYWRNRCDVVFNLSVGYRGLDRKSFVPGILELAAIPYVGSGAYALSLTRHKFHAKLVVAAAGVATAPSCLWTGPSSSLGLGALNYPVIVKPVAESSSIGIDGDSIVATPAAAAERAAWLLRRLRQPALVESFVEGIEVEVPLVGSPDLMAQGVVGITIGSNLVRGKDHLASAAVYGDSYGFLANVPEIDVAAVKASALQAAVALGIRDYGRIDFRVPKSGSPVFMEASTHPHIQPHSSFFALAKERGLSYSAMLSEILEAGLLRLGLQSSQNSMSQ